MRRGNEKKTYMCDNPRRRIKIQLKKKEKNIETRVAARRYLLSQTYTLMPNTTQRNSKECCIWTCSHVHAGKAMTISENNGKCRWYLQSKNRQIRWQKDKELSGGVFLKKRKTIFTSHERSRSHATNTISTWNFLMVESGKTIFQSYFLETWRS